MGNITRPLSKAKLYLAVRNLATVNPFTAELLFKAWHVSGNLVLQINLTVKYLETIYENVHHALRNSATYHN